MDKKIEKYINYIVDNLVKDTEIDYDEGILNIILPPDISDTPILLPLSLSFLSHPRLSLSLTYYFSSYLSKYVQERYGAREQEMEIIMKLYVERILTLINE